MTDLTTHKWDENQWLNRLIQLAWPIVKVETVTRGAGRITVVSIDTHAEPHAAELGRQLTTADQRRDWPVYETVWHAAIVPEVGSSFIVLEVRFEQPMPVRFTLGFPTSVHYAALKQTASALDKGWLYDGGHRLPHIEQRPQIGLHLNERVWLLDHRPSDLNRMLLQAGEHAAASPDDQLAADVKAPFRTFARRYTSATESKAAHTRVQVALLQHPAKLRNVTPYRYQVPAELNVWYVAIVGDDATMRAVTPSLFAALGDDSSGKWVDLEPEFAMALWVRRLDALAYHPEKVKRWR
jgi:hypothetical protein